jgi:hypothetical protein
MKKKITSLLCLITLLFCSMGTAYAVKPGAIVNPNGFPSGAHYNLNIHGKKVGFTCPEQEYYLEITKNVEGSGYSLGDLVKECPDGYVCSETNTPIYGNSIFVPENGIGIEILMQSGKMDGKGKKALALPQNELWAVDPCAVFDGDGAVIQLPPGEYDVYARTLAKPTGNPDLTVTPELISAEDEKGNDLLYLGLITENGFSTPFATFTRNKGKSKAIPITDLFEWSGYVRYFDDIVDDLEQFFKCCSDTDDDGFYDTCVDSVIDPDTGVEICETGDLTDIYCKTYSNEWIFNISDFATYMWNTENNGLKLLQIRFYPRN